MKNITVRYVLPNDEVLGETALQINDGSLIVLQGKDESVTLAQATQWFNNTVNALSGVGGEEPMVMYLPHDIEFKVLEFTP